MPPKKVVKEPDVVIPNGDPAAGRGIFDAVLIILDKYSNVQHAMLWKVMIKQLQLHH